MTETKPRGMWVLRTLSAVSLLAAGGIHLYLVFNGVGGILGVMFVLNAVAALVLAIAMIALPGRLFRVATVLSLLFLIVTLMALVLALTIGLFGITVAWDFMLVRETVIVESIGVVVLAVTTLLRVPVCARLTRRSRAAGVLFAVCIGVGWRTGPSALPDAHHRRSTELRGFPTALPRWRNASSDNQREARNCHPTAGSPRSYSGAWGFFFFLAYIGAAVLLHRHLGRGSGSHPRDASVLLWPAYLIYADAARATSAGSRSCRRSRLRGRASTLREPQCTAREVVRPRRRHPPPRRPTCQKE